MTARGCKDKQIQCNFGQRLKITERVHKSMQDTSLYGVSTTKFLPSSLSCRSEKPKHNLLRMDSDTLTQLLIGSKLKITCAQVKIICKVPLPAGEVLSHFTEEQPRAERWSSCPRLRSWTYSSNRISSQAVWLQTAQGCTNSLLKRAVKKVTISSLGKQDSCCTTWILLSSVPQGSLSKGHRLPAPSWTHGLN